MPNSLKDCVYRGASQWTDCFESKDPVGCALCYEETASLVVEPFGTFRGRKAIEEFWDDLTGDGYYDLRFVQQRLTVVDAAEVHRQGIWTMSKAYGSLIDQVWVVKGNGTALMARDHFRFLGMITGGRQERSMIETILRNEHVSSC